MVLHFQTKVMRLQWKVKSPVFYTIHQFVYHPKFFTNLLTKPFSACFTHAVGFENFTIAHQKSPIKIPVFFNNLTI